MFHMMVRQNYKSSKVISLIILIIEVCLKSVNAAVSNCGSRPLDLVRSGRIVGGRDAYYGEVPWQALIKEKRFFGLWKKNKCGGVLIDDKWVITAAHCNAGMFGSLQVILGEHNLKDSSIKSPVIRTATRVVVHPKYNPHNLDYDLALIELDESIKYEPDIQPICLPSEDAIFEHKDGYVSGWGVLSFEKRDIPEVLQIVKVPIMRNDQCQSMFHKVETNIAIKSFHLCAGFALGGKDSCEGDSGGPLTVRNEVHGNWILAGIVSNGIKCAEPNMPGIYTRISKFRDWIHQVTSASLITSTPSSLIATPDQY